MGVRGGGTIVCGLTHGYIDTNVSLAGADTSIIFVVTKVLSRQTRVCRDKRVFVAMRHVFCRDKKYACRNKIMFVATNM